MRFRIRFVFGGIKRNLGGRLKQCEHQYFSPRRYCYSTIRISFIPLTLVFNGSSVRKNIVANVFCAIVVALIFVFFDELF